MIFGTVKWFMLAGAGVNLLFPQHAVAQSRNAPDSEILAIQADIERGEWKLALERAASSAARFPTDGGLENLVGVVFAQQGDVRSARLHFEKAVKLAPRLAGAWRNLARLYEADPATAKAAATAYARYLTLKPGDSEARLRYAQTLSATNAHASSIAEIQKLPPELRDSTEAVLVESASLTSLGQHAKALELANTIQKRLPHDPRPLGQLARIAYSQGDHKRALGYLAHARDLDPSDAGVHFFFGLVCVELDLPAEARQSLAKAVKLAPGVPVYHYALGAVLLQGIDAAEAEKQIQLYVDARPDDPRGRFALGVTHFQLKDHQTALKHFQAVAARPETRAGAAYYLGKIARLENRYAEAIPLLRSAVSMLPGYADARAELATALLRSGQTQAALLEIDRTLKLDADNRIANQALLVLYQKTSDTRVGAQRERMAELDRKRDEFKNLLVRGIEIQR